MEIEEGVEREGNSLGSFDFNNGWNSWCVDILGRVVKGIFGKEEKRDVGIRIRTEGDGIDEGKNKEENSNMCDTNNYFPDI